MKGQDARACALREEYERDRRELKERVLELREQSRRLGDALEEVRDVVGVVSRGDAEAFVGTSRTRDELETAGAEAAARVSARFDEALDDVNAVPRLRRRLGREQAHQGPPRRPLPVPLQGARGAALHGGAARLPRPRGLLGDAHLHPLRRARLGAGRVRRVHGLRPRRRALRRRERHGAARRRRGWRRTSSLHLPSTSPTPPPGTATATRTACQGTPATITLEPPSSGSMVTARTAGRPPQLRPRSTPATLCLPESVQFWTEHLRPLDTMRSCCPETS